MASDWMEMEQQRGISISAAARHGTLLDTPGHQDFSEDTCRTRLAVDSAVMVVPPVRFPPIPQCAAERSATIRPVDARQKEFDQAVRQLAEEGLLQMFLPKTGPRHPVIGWQDSPPAAASGT